MNILVTGGAGFIGSNFIHYMLDIHEKDTIVNLDALTYAGNTGNLQDIEKDKRYTFVQGSITDRGLVERIVKCYSIDTIINFAAESHVDRSIENPQLFVETNVLGTLTLLNVAKNYRIKRYIQISTDEVYGSLGETGKFTESTPLAPRSPYSASKACADVLVQSYHETYGLPTNITRCSNNYGPYQFPEKLIPLFITRGVKDQPLPLYGTGENVRDWLHVFDHCAAIDCVLRSGIPGEIYNIGGNNEHSNRQVASIIMDRLNLRDTQLIHVTDRLGHDYRYAIDASKIQEMHGWTPSYTFEKGIKETIDWYLSHQDWWKPLIPSL